MAGPVVPFTQPNTKSPAGPSAFVFGDILTDGPAGGRDDEFQCHAARTPTWAWWRGSRTRSSPSSRRRSDQEVQGGDRLRDLRRGRRGLEAGPALPVLPSRAHQRDSVTPAGRRRWRCAGCGRTYTALTGTVFEHSKSDLPTWAAFVRLMCYNAQVDLAAEALGISHVTAFEWRHRVMATLGGVQGRVALRDRCWVDEMFFEDSSLRNTPGWRPARPVPQPPVRVGGDRRAQEPRRGRLRPRQALRQEGEEALGGRIAKGTTIVHDMEKAHGPLVRAVGGARRPTRRRPGPGVPRGDEDGQQPLRLDQALRRGLRGDEAGQPQEYLDCTLPVPRDDERWPKTARVLRHLMLTDARYRSSRVR